MRCGLFGEVNCLTRGRTERAPARPVETRCEDSQVGQPASTLFGQGLQHLRPAIRVDICHRYVPHLYVSFRV